MYRFLYAMLLGYYTLLGPVFWIATKAAIACSYVQQKNYKPLGRRQALKFERLDLKSFQKADKNKQLDIYVKQNDYLIPLIDELVESLPSHKRIAHDYALLIRFCVAIATTILCYLFFLCVLLVVRLDVVSWVVSRPILSFVSLASIVIYINAKVYRVGLSKYGSRQVQRPAIRSQAPAKDKSKPLYAGENNQQA